MRSRIDRRRVAGIRLPALRPPRRCQGAIGLGRGNDVSIVPARIDRTLRQMVASDRVAGAMVLIWKNGREIYFGTRATPTAKRRSHSGATR